MCRFLPVLFQHSRVSDIRDEIIDKELGRDSLALIRNLQAPSSYTAVSFLELMKILIKYSIPDESDKRKSLFHQKKLFRLTSIHKIL